MPAYIAPRLGVYGPSKVGKTTAAVAACHHGLLIAAEGSLDPVQTHLGIPIADLRVEQANTLTDVLNVLKKYESDASIPSVYVDDLSLAVGRQTAGKQINWRDFDREIQRFIDYATTFRSRGIPFLFTAHEQPARMSSGKFVRGGPQLPGQGPEKLAASVDTIVRVVSEETMQPWPFVLWTRSRKDWIAGDRLAILPDCGPVNIGEAFRMMGIPVPRPKCMPWADKAVDAWSAAITAAGLEGWRDAIRPMVMKAQGKVDPRHVRWVAQDALHRAIITNKRNDVSAWLDEGQTSAASIEAS